MATFVFGMNQSLDGYVDHTAFGPGPELFHIPWCSGTASRSFPAPSRGSA